MARRFDALDRLWQSARESHHDFRPTTDLFPVLDVERMARDLDLEAEGRKRGQQDQPPPETSSFDTVELAVVERIESEQAKAVHSLEDTLDTFSSRLASLDFEEQFGLVRQARDASLSEFKAEAVKGTDELHGLRRALRDAENYSAWFRKRHRLVRPAHAPGGWIQYLKWAVIAAVFLLESGFNGVYLAKGSEQGLLGGVTEAAGFSAINIAVALLSALFAIRYVVHRNWAAKLFGLFWIPVYMVLALVLNLALAHYRDASGTLLEGASREVVAAMTSHPFVLQDINSWTLFAIGIVFSLVALIDGFAMRDPYPGYASAEKKLRAARDLYIDRKQELIDVLQDVRDEHNDKVRDVIHDLSVRRREHAAILAHRNRVLNLFENHEEQLERAARFLLNKYREANVKARKSAAPKHFSDAFDLKRKRPAYDPVQEDAGIAAAVAEAQKELSEQAGRIGQECAARLDEYHRLDTLFPEGQEERDGEA